MLDKKKKTTHSAIFTESGGQQGRRYTSSFDHPSMSSLELSGSFGGGGSGESTPRYSTMSYSSGSQRSNGAGSSGLHTLSTSTSRDTVPGAFE